MEVKQSNDHQLSLFGLSMFIPLFARVLFHMSGGSWGISEPSNSINLSSSFSKAEAAPGPRPFPRGLDLEKKGGRVKFRHFAKWATFLLNPV